MDFGNIGVFLCSCGKTLNLDYKRIAKDLEKLEEVAVVERVEQLCTEEGLAYIVDDLRRKELDKIVIGACSGKTEIFEEVAGQMGLDPIGVEIINIREECAWVHEDKKSATQKARVLLKSSIKKEQKFPEIVEVEVGQSILIAGDIRAVDLADDLADFDLDIHILSEEPYFKRGLVASTTFSPSSKGSIFEFQEANFHSGSKILGITGDLGDFTVEIENGRHIDMRKCVDCGKCIETCEPKAIVRAVDSTLPAYVIDEKCNSCGECVKVCPRDALTIEPEVESLNVGQIISFYPLKPREGVYVIDEKADGEAAQKAALQAALNIKGYKKERFIESDLKKCANHHLMEKNLDLKGCTYCEDSCAYFPVSSGVVSDLACKGCGSCVTACPQNTYNLAFQSFDDLLREVDLTAEADIKSRIVMFTCSEGGYSTLRAAGMNQLKYPPAIPIIVPCLGNVSELHILRALDLGAEGVVLLGCGSDSCMYGGGFSRGSKSVGMAKSVLDSFGIGKERVRMLSADGTDPNKFAAQMKEFEERLKLIGKSPLAKKGAADLDSIGKKERKKRAVLYALLSDFSLKTGVKDGRIEGDLPVGFLSVNEKECTLCGACAYHCNAGAFRHEGGDILDIFNTHTHCIGCGICEEICPENAIVLERFLDIESFLEKREKKFDVKIINCTKCGKPLMAEAAFNKLKKRLGERDLEMLQKCQGCLDKGTVADILNIDADSEDYIVIQQGKTPWDS